MINTIQIYCKSMGKVFRVREIVTTAEEANAYCQRHTDVGVIANDAKSGLIFLADINGLTVPSSVFP